MPRIFRIVSIVAHVVVVGAVLFADFTVVGPLPVPREPIAFASTIPVRVIDIPLPAPSRQTGAARSSALRSDLSTPLIPPDSLPSDSGATPPIGSAPGENPVSGWGTGVGLTPIQLVPDAPPPPPPPQRAPVHVVGMQAPRKLVHVDPTYPAVARSAHVEGVVILEATLDSRGRVVDLRVLRSVPLLDAAAVEAVRQWIYTPTLLNGTAVPVVMTVTVNFKLTDR